MLHYAIQQLLLQLLFFLLLSLRVHLPQFQSFFVLPNVARRGEETEQRIKLSLLVLLDLLHVLRQCDDPALQDFRVFVRRTLDLFLFFLVFLLTVRVELLLDALATSRIDHHTVLVAMCLLAFNLCDRAHRKLQQKPAPITLHADLVQTRADSQVRQKLCRCLR